MFNELIEEKLEVAENYCHLSSMPQSYREVSKIIPNNIIMELRPRDIGKLIDNIWVSWRKTKELKEAEILDEGCIWDTKNNKLIEFA